MTNILYIGITAMLDDTWQIQAHWKNFVLLLESLRFGDGDPAARRSGILEYEDLLSIVLALDGNCPIWDDLPARWSRSWVVKLPQYSRFTSTTQAYIGLLAVLHKFLHPAEILSSNVKFNATHYDKRISILNKIEMQQVEFARSPEAAAVKPHDHESLELIRQFVRILKIKERSITRTRRDEVIRDEKELATILEYVDATLSRSPIVAQPYLQIGAAVSVFSVLWQHH